MGMAQSNQLIDCFYDYETQMVASRLSCNTRKGFRRTLYLPCNEEMIRFAFGNWYWYIECMDCDRYVIYICETCNCGDILFTNNINNNKFDNCNKKQ